MIPAQRTVVAVVTERGNDPLVTAAINAAKENDARLIVYVHDAAHRFGGVRRTFWSADAPRRTSPLLSAAELECSGEHRCAMHVARAKADGVEAYGLLATRPGPAGLRDAAARQHPDVVVVDDHDGAFVEALRAWSVAALDRTVVVTR